jgi:crossover junction endodeoxyribonuclease RuvC
MRTSRPRSWRAFDPSAPRTGVAAPTVNLSSGRLASDSARILGLDPGSRHTGFGILECHGGEALYIACGAISTTADHFADRLQQIFQRVRELMTEYRPTEVAIERVFVNKNPDSALKLGQARGAALCGAFSSTVEVFEYSPREVKMAIVGSGAADKQQVQHMVKALLKIDTRLKMDASDALAIALCHVHGRQVRALLQKGLA